MLTTSYASGNGAHILPPNSNAFGHSLAYWLVQAEVHPNTLQQGNVLVGLPADYKVIGGSGTFADPVIVTSTVDVTLKAGTAFVAEALRWLSETGEIILPDSFWGFGNYISSETILDGKTVISYEDCLDYYVPPQPVDPPLSNGGYSIQGFIFACKPLSVGVHTLALNGSYMFPPGSVAGELGVVASFKWTITVVP